MKILPKNIDLYSPKGREIVDFLQEKLGVPDRAIRYKIVIEAGEPIKVVDLDFYPGATEGDEEE